MPTMDDIRNSLYVNDTTWMAIASYPEEPIAGRIAPRFIQGVAPVTAGYDRDVTEMLALLSIIASNQDAHITSMIRWPHPYVYVVPAFEFFEGKAMPLVFHAEMRAATTLTNHIWGMNVADWPDWAIDQMIDETIEAVKDTGDPEGADILYTMLLNGPSPSLQDMDKIIAYEDIVHMFYKLPKELLEKMFGEERIIWSYDFEQYPVIYSEYRRSRYPVDRLQPYISQDYEYPFPNSELPPAYDGIPADVRAAMAETPEEVRTEEEIERVMDAIGEAVKEHARDIAGVVGGVTDDVAREMGYDSVPKMLAEGVRSAAKRLRLDKALEWMGGKTLKMFAPKGPSAQLPWGEQRKRPKKKPKKKKKKGWR